MSTSRVIRRGIAYLALAFAVSLPLAEGAVRLLGYMPANATVAVFRGFGDGNYRLKSDITSREDWASGTFWIHTNELGLRCDEDGEPHIASGDDVDTLVLGDSQAFGLGLDYEQSIVGVAAERAARDGAVIANAAVGGHYVRNQFELLRHLVEEEGLKVRRAALLLTSRGLEIPDGFSRVNVDEEGRLFGETPSAKARIKFWLRTNLGLYALVRAAHANTIRSKEHSERDDAAVEVFRARNADRLTAAWIEEMRGLRDWLRDRDSELVVVYLPETFDFELNAMAAKRGAAWSDVDARNPLEVCKRVCDELDIRLVDIWPVLERRKAAGEMLHLGTDFHYNADTSRDVGEALWDALSRP